MRTDLLAGMGIVAAASLVAFLVAWRGSRGWGRSAVLVALLAGVASLVAYLKFVVDAAWVAGALPLSNLVVVGNWTPTIAALLAGVAWHQIGRGSGVGTAARRLLVLGPFVGLSAWLAWSVAFAEPPPTRPMVDGGLWMQSTDATCSAAAAATLLNAHGIAASEGEMARLCLTSPRGTSMWGVYRGLRLKTEGTPWRVEPLGRLGGATLADLRSAGSPVLLSAGILPGERADPAYTAVYGWSVGLLHTVVCFGFDDRGRALIADPTTGRERWTADDLRTLWHGQAYRLVRREGDGVATAE